MLSFRVSRELAADIQRQIGPQTLSELMRSLLHRWLTESKAASGREKS